MTKDELLEALLIERYDNRWWRHRPAKARPATWVAEQFIDDEVTCARRRRDLLVALDEREEKAI